MSGQPSHIFFAQAVTAFQNGRLGDAEHGFKKFLRREPKHFGALNLYAALLMQTDRFAEAEPVLNRAIRTDSRSDKTFYNYGLVLKNLKKFDESFEAFSRAIEISPVSAETWNNRGTVLNDLERYDEAIADFDRAISVAPNYAEAFYNKGQSLFAAERLIEAIAAYSEALGLNPQLCEAWNAIGHAYLKLKRYEEADSAFQDALKIDNKYAKALAGRGHVLLALGQHDNAFEVFKQAAELDPNTAEVWLDFGYLCMRWNRFNDAQSLFAKALRLDSNLAPAWRGLAETYGIANEWSTALAGYEAAIKIDPNMDGLQGARMQAASHVCLWQDMRENWTRCLASIEAGQPNIDPFSFLSKPGSAAAQFSCTSSHSKKYYPPNRKKKALTSNSRQKTDRIRIAYLSGDLRDHAVAILAAGLFEHHDQSKFSTIALSTRPESETPFGQRLKNAFDEFHDVSKMSDANIAELMQSRQIDIAVDLSGYTAFGRPGVLALRPSPVQVNYLGYPGTMASDHYDYIIADRIIIPPGDEQHYSEKIVRLPDAYQPNDRKRQIADVNSTRAESGLPEKAFVFCCFNNNYKITPDIFDVWMRLLAKVEGSVLWLLATNESAQYNLQKEAEARGVDPSRIIFTKYVTSAEHLARHRLVDLFLDTLYYNAHTTASDALWAGLPLVTCIGSAFAGRVAASLLTAIGLPELITTTLEDYEALALKLALDPALLASIKAKLAANRLITPLFDTERYTRHLEAAYITMYERALRGEPPESFAVEPLSGDRDPHTRSVPVL